MKRLRWEPKKVFKVPDFFLWVPEWQGPGHLRDSDRRFIRVAGSPAAYRTISSAFAELLEQHAKRGPGTRFFHSNPPNRLPEDGLDLGRGAISHQDFEKRYSVRLHWFSGLRVKVVDEAMNVRPAENPEWDDQTEGVVTVSSTNEVEVKTDAAGLERAIRTIQKSSFPMWGAQRLFHNRSSDGTGSTPFEAVMMACGWLQLD